MSPNPIVIQAPKAEANGAVPFFRALKEYRRPIEYWIFPDEFHLFAWPGNKAVIQEQSLDWFRFWLQDEEDPAPGKAPQYDRWCTLKMERDAALRMSVQPRC